MEKFEAFFWNFSSSINLVFLKSAIGNKLYPVISWALNPKDIKYNSNIRQFGHASANFF